MIYRGQPLEQLDGQAWQGRVVFMVDVLRQDGNQVVAMATVLRQGLLQGGHRVRRGLQPDHVVGDREGQLHRLDQNLTRALRVATRGGQSGMSTKLEPKNYSNNQLSRKQDKV